MILPGSVSCTDFKNRFIMFICSDLICDSEKEYNFLRKLGQLTSKGFKFILNSLHALRVTGTIAVLTADCGDKKGQIIKL